MFLALSRPFNLFALLYILFALLLPRYPTTLFTLVHNPILPYLPYFESDGKNNLKREDQPYQLA